MAIVVRDIEQALKVYRDVLGLEVSHTEEIPERGLRVAFLRTGDVNIELIQPLHEGSEVSRFLERRGEGLHHFALRVGDLEDVLGRAQASGIEIASGPAKGSRGTKVAFLHPRTTCGVLVELVGPDD